MAAAKKTKTPKPKQQPHLQMAFICEHVLQENVFSAGAALILPLIFSAFKLRRGVAAMSFLPIAVINGGHERR